MTWNESMDGTHSMMLLDGSTDNYGSGPVGEYGANGTTIEYVILINRLNEFQSGPFANHYNETAIDNLQTALLVLETRPRSS